MTLCHALIDHLGRGSSMENEIKHPFLWHFLWKYILNSSSLGGVVNSQLSLKHATTNLKQLPNKWSHWNCYFLSRISLKASLGDQFHLRLTLSTIFWAILGELCILSSDIPHLFHKSLRDMKIKIYNYEQVYLM